MRDTSSGVVVVGGLAVAWRVSNLFWLLERIYPVYPRGEHIPPISRI